MNREVYSLLGVIGPVIAYVSIGVSILFSPWFSWNRNALSDLGHAVKSGVAPIYNFGLLLAGSLIMIYAVKAFKEHAAWTSYSLVLTAFTLQLVAMFDEVYGLLHFVVSLLFFGFLGFTSLLYAVEKRSYLAATALIVSVVSWTIYWTGPRGIGVAVPETISSVAAVLWVISSAIKIYKAAKQ